MFSKCRGDIPCEGCRLNAKARSWTQPCQRAKFMDLVEQGPCTTVCEGDDTALFLTVQHSASTRSLDRTSKMMLPFAGKFDLNRLMGRLNALQAQYNISVRQCSDSSSLLDLTKITEIMSRLDKAHQLGSFELDDFYQHKFSKPSDWLGCVFGYGSSANAVVGDSFLLTHRFSSY